MDAQASEWRDHESPTILTSKLHRPRSSHVLQSRYAVNAAKPRSGRGFSRIRVSQKAQFWHVNIATNRKIGLRWGMIEPSQVQRYELRMRVVGTLHWLCPACGNLNRTRLWPVTWRLQCRGSSCRRKFLFGYRLLQLKKGVRAIRPLDVSFPVGEFAEYDGRQAHRMGVWRPRNS